MANKKGLFILAFALLLSGCGNSELEITKNDILEVARDDANATKKECSNVNVQEEKKYYTVTFDTNSGSYEYKIGKDGIIQDRNYKRTSDEEEVVEPKKTTTPVETSPEETKKEEKESKNSFDANQQQAIDAALANAGLGTDDVTDIKCTLNENTNQYTVTFDFQGTNNTSVVDASSFAVLSTIIG
ncbi:hypothetical protein [Holdemanella biformis]|uniref:hypothetical protein n=1 Tax=Holdemanella biformis TaxID=1735 RepID=UPI002E7809D7|nr:hypothetical protein [Holdemanella biformis]